MGRGRPPGATIEPEHEQVPPGGPGRDRTWPFPDRGRKTIAFLRWPGDSIAARNTKMATIIVGLPRATHHPISSFFLRRRSRGAGLEDRRALPEDHRAREKSHQPWSISPASTPSRSTGVKAGMDRGNLRQPLPRGQIERLRAKSANGGARKGQRRRMAGTR